MSSVSPSGAAGEPVEIEGTVERVVFSSEESGWSVVRIRTRRGLGGELTAVGVAPPLRPGDAVRVGGRFVLDPKWGEQLRMESCRVLPPSTTAGLERWLASGALKGVGPGLATRLVGHFGLDLPKVLDEEPHRLSEVRGFGAGRIAAVKRSWGEQRAVHEIMVFLQSVGASPAFARRIFRMYGDRAVEIVRTDPYRLALEVDGIGFLTADRIARQAGLPGDSPRRAAAGLLHLIGEAGREGHTVVPVAELLGKAEELLGSGHAPLEPALGELVGSGIAVAERLDDGEPAVAERGLALSEASAAKRLGRLLAAPPRLDASDVDRALAGHEAGSGLVLSPEQREAVRQAAESKVLVLTGGPGTGKTTIVAAILAIFAAKRARILLASPTGRAARRLAEATGREAKTIHRLLEWNPGSGGFSRDESRPLEADLVVVDESSMIDIALFASLLRALPPPCRLVLVGDADQLPSVGPGRVLQDLVDSGSVPTVRLSRIFRQAEASLIVTNAHRILRGEMPVTAPGADEGDFFLVERDDAEEAAKMVVEMAAERIPRRFGLDPVADVQVLTPMKRGVLGSGNLNRALQAALNPSGPSFERGARLYRLGDKVIQLENDYEKDVFNGDLGRIVELDDEEGAVAVRFDDRLVEYDGEELDRLAPAWAMTVHKSQGSEYPAVVLVMHGQHFPLLQRNLLYTGVTRGRRLVVVVGSRRALALAVENARIAPRRTLLARRLRGAASGECERLPLDAGGTIDTPRGGC